MLKNLTLLATAVVSTPALAQSGVFGPDSDRIVGLLSQGHLDRAAPALRKCQNDQLGNNVNVAFTCSITLSGILRARGQTSEWAANIRWMRETAGSATDDSEDARLISLEVEKHIDFDSLIEIPPFSKMVPTGTIIIPASSSQDIASLTDSERSDLAGHYVIPFRVGDQKTHAVLDTGAIDFIIMAPVVADKLGIHYFLGLTPQRSTPYMAAGRDQLDEYRIADKLIIGGAVYRNVLVRVDRSDRLPTILGSGYLSQFQNARITKQDLTINLPSLPQSCQWHGFFFRGSPYIGNSDYVVAVTYEGKPYPASIDTGITSTLSFVNPLARNIAARSQKMPLFEGLDWVTARPLGKQSVKLGGMTITDSMARGYVETADMPSQVVLGAGMLDFSDMYLNFEEGSVCFTPPGPNSST